MSAYELLTLGNSQVSSFGRLDISWSRIIYDLRYFFLGRLLILLCVKIIVIFVAILFRFLIDLASGRCKLHLLLGAFDFSHCLIASLPFE